MHRSYAPCAQLYGIVVPLVAQFPPGITGAPQTPYQPRCFIPYAGIAWRVFAPSGPLSAISYLVSVLVASSCRVLSVLAEMAEMRYTGGMRAKGEPGTLGIMGSTFHTSDLVLTVGDVRFRPREAMREDPSSCLQAARENVSSCLQFTEQTVVFSFRIRRLVSSAALLL